MERIIITGNIPSFEQTAKDLGVSTRRVNKLIELLDELFPQENEALIHCKMRTAAKPRLFVTKKQVGTGHPIKVKVSLATHAKGHKIGR